MRLRNKTAIVTGASHGTARAASPAAWPPVTLLKITVWPKRFSAARAKPRAERSLPPPAAYGQTIVTGRSGKCAAVRSRPRRRKTKPAKQRTTIHRSQSLWLGFGGMPVFSFTWPYQRVLQEEGEDPKIGISYPDGFVSKDGKWLHLVYDDNRDKLIYDRARLPELPTPGAGNEATKTDKP